MKHILNFLLALSICYCASPVIAEVFNYAITPGQGFVIAVGAAFVKSFATPQGVAQDGVLRDLWTGELVDKMRWLDRQWLNRITSKNEYVNNDVINLAEIGADPEVLINNTSYPIAVAGRTDEPLVISLNKFETENTSITDDELYALPYDKQGSVISQHRVSLEVQIAKKGLHQLTPASDTADTPVVLTTGGDNGFGRKRLTIPDLVLLKKRWDDLEIPLEGRILPLCTDHVSDMLLLDQSFRDRYYNTETGKILAKIMGFEMYEDIYCAKFNASNVKKAFGAAAAGTDRNASTAFHTNTAVKADGSVKMFMSLAENDPLNRKTIIGFKRYNIIINKTAKGTAALVSDAYTS